MSADEQIAAFLDYVRMNNVALVREGALLDTVRSAVSIIEAQGDEGTKLQARLYRSLIQDGLRDVQNDPNRTFLRNVLWAALDPGMILSPDRSAKEIERIRAKMRSEMARLAGRRSGAARKEKRPWVPHAKELAMTAYSADPSASDGKLADEILGSWKLGRVKCPVHRTLTEFISNLRANGELPQRTGSFPK
jgi:hypothetical protein